jgi:hypothetical protein
MMKRLLLFAAALSVAGCAVPSLPAPPPPAAYADATTLDESFALQVEGIYRTSRAAMEIAVDGGRLKGANASRAAALDNRAYSAVQAMRAAYRAGNADSYMSAVVEAVSAVNALLSVVEVAK